MLVKLEKRENAVHGVKTVGRILAQTQKDDQHVAIKKTEKEQQLVYGEVYAPMVPDAHGDYMRGEAIQEMAHQFLKDLRLTKIDMEHDELESGAYVVESFIARNEDPDFIPGSWVIGVHVPDQEQWQLVKSGKLNGFSFSGMGFKKKTEVVLDVPEEITGMTSTVEGHAHTFTVRYGADGSFLGGETSPAEDGHVHKITSGTITSMVEGHQHRFSFVEGVLNVEAVS